MTPFDEEMKALNKVKESLKKEDKEYIQIIKRQTDMFLALAKILENGNKK